MRMKTRHTGVFEHVAKDGTVTIHIRYKVNGKVKRESLGVKGAFVDKGGRQGKLTANLASLIRADRMTQVARSGEEVLLRRRVAPTLKEVWELHKEDKSGTPGLEAAQYPWKYIERWADLRLDEINESDITKARNEWRTDPAFHTQFKKAPSETTINHALKLLLQLYHLAKGRKLYFGRVPLDMQVKQTNGKIKLKTNRQLDNERDRYLDPDEALAILDWCRKDSHQLWLQVNLLLLTGARLAEITGDTRRDKVTGLPKRHGLRWMDVDFKNQQITLLRKGDRYHTIPVDSEVIEILENEKYREPSQRVTGYRFRRERWKKMVEELALNPEGTIDKKKITPHTLRHTYATWFLEDGGDIKNLSWLMNHSSIEVTARYLHLNKDAQRRGNATIAKRIRDAKKAKFKVVKR